MPLAAKVRQEHEMRVALRSLYKSSTLDMKTRAGRTLSQLVRPALSVGRSHPWKGIGSLEVMRTSSTMPFES
eukprot:675283-Amphidinium_carterae.1